MTGKNVTRVDLYAAIYERSNLSRSASVEMVELVLREITDTSGGRTEIIWQPGDLDGATAGIADELSKQYFLGYPAGSNKKDGRWHMIRVEVENPNYIVRARRGYVATP